jgi:hypothetical protein
MPRFRHRTELLTTNPKPISDNEGRWMSKITTNTVPCCATDISKGRIWWEWFKGIVSPQKSPRLRRSATTPMATGS